MAPTDGPGGATLLVAPRILADAERWIDGGGLLVRRGRIEAVAATPAARRRLARRPGVRERVLASGCLTPGLVNAHAHLELSALAGRVPGERGFVPWIRALMAERALVSPGSLAERAREAGLALLRGGTTTVGDIASLAVGLDAAVGAGLRAVVYREVLDAWHEERTTAVLATVERRLPPRARRVEGLSPHAPYTTSAALLAGLAALARAPRLPLACHWAETAEEDAWLAGEGGELAALVGRSGPGRSALELYEAAGLLARGMALVHGNHPRRGEPARIAAAGSCVVHCPGTHRFFGREPFPWGRYRRAGVALALGTDSLASNERLDMRREMRLARESSGLSPAEVFTMATRGGARALGMEQRVGSLEEGRAADLVLWACEATSRAEALEELTQAELPTLGVWVAGRRRPFGSSGGLA